MRQDISYVVIDTLNYELSTHALTRSLEQFHWKIFLSSVIIQAVGQAME